MKVGEPRNPVSTAVCGRTSLVPADTTLVALDHDMTRASLTPSVILQVQLKPDATADTSFVRGKVTTTINDSVTDPSSLFPTLDLDKLQKASTRKCHAYNAKKKVHCRETEYAF